jgi:hypothetical protein
MSYLHPSTRERRAHLTDAPYSRHADWWKNPEGNLQKDVKAPSRYSHKISNYKLPRRRKTNWSILYLSSDAKALTEAEMKFRYYAAKWKEEIGGDSSLTNITSNMNYLRIIAIGDEALPLILQELQKQPAPWFVALRAISEDDSVGRNSPGDFRKKAADWIQWGKENGHI